MYWARLGPVDVSDALGPVESLFRKCSSTPLFLSELFLAVATLAKASGNFITKTPPGFGVLGVRLPGLHLSCTNKWFLNSTTISGFCY